MLHVVERGRGTIKKSSGRLHDSIMAQKASKKHGARPCTRECVVTWEGWKVIVAATIHDKVSHLRHQGVSGGPLRHRADWICRQNHINKPCMRSTTEFEVERVYKENVACYHILFGPFYSKLFRIRIEWHRINEALIKGSPWFKDLPKVIQESLLKSISTTEDITAEIPK